MAEFFIISKPNTKLDFSIVFFLHKTMSFHFLLIIIQKPISHIKFRKIAYIPFHSISPWNHWYNIEEQRYNTNNILAEILVRQWPFPFRWTPSKIHNFHIGELHFFVNIVSYSLVPVKLNDNKIKNTKHASCIIRIMVVCIYICM